MLVWALQSQDQLGKGHPSLSLDPPFLLSRELMFLCSTTSLLPAGAHCWGSCWLFPVLCQGCPQGLGAQGSAPCILQLPGGQCGIQTGAGIAGDRWGYPVALRSGSAIVQE